MIDAPPAWQVSGCQAGGGRKERAIPVVWIPALLRDLTGGAAQVEVPGANLREVIDHLELRFPGIRSRLVEGDTLRPNLTAVVDGMPSQNRLRERVSAESEIHFLPSISGGAG